MTTDLHPHQTHPWNPSIALIPRFIVHPKRPGFSTYERVPGYSVRAFTEWGCYPLAYLTEDCA